MKKAKIMLIAIAILATVGGALAFKANQKFSFKYCIGTTINNANKLCPTFSDGYKTDLVVGTSLYYRSTKADGTAVAVAADCNNLVCPTSSLITPQQ